MAFMFPNFSGAQGKSPRPLYDENYVISQDLCHACPACIASLRGVVLGLWKIASREPRPSPPPNPPGGGSGWAAGGAAGGHTINKMVKVQKNTFLPEEEI